MIAFGKTYKMPSGLYVKLQGVSRSLVLMNEGVKHFVEISFNVIGDAQGYVCRTPVAEIFPKGDAKIDELMKFILSGPRLLESAPRGLSELSGSTSYTSSSPQQLPLPFP